MTGNLYGLNRYVKDSPKKFGFSNFQWVRQDALARNSQPGYVAGDAGHTVRAWDVGFLRANKIVCVISADERNMDDDRKARPASRCRGTAQARSDRSFPTMTI